ncbi:MAG: hypothetical protein ICV66_12900, partial [Chitinophagaceae bacterium]|nr:hypothetical protein [Chitinophagaceae bacterium]
TETIEFLPEFESEEGDAFTAYITEGSSGSGNASGLNGTDGLYRYGFNGQEKSDEIAGEGNHTTTEFWEYDARTGRRWNKDPRPDVSISVYSAFSGNPIWFSDPLGDTTKIYGNAEVTNTTLLDKGGVKESAAKATMYKDAQINPVYAKDGKSLVGYNVYDKTNSSLGHPILQLESEADLASFKEHYKWQFAGAQLYYANGEPSEGMKKMSAGLETGNLGMVWQGVKQENKAAWSNPVFVAQMVLSLAHAGTNVADRSSLILPNREQNGVVKFTYNGMSNVTGGRSGGKAPLLGNPNSYTITKGGHMIFYEANGRALWDVSKDRVKVWEWNNGFPKDGGYVTRNVPDALKSIIDASKK